MSRDNADLPPAAADDATLAAYDRRAAQFFDEWMSQPSPLDLYADLRRHFEPGAATADIGCGSGREVAWLNAHGYPASGYDASPALLALARSRFPHYRFDYARLPQLAEISASLFRNVLCETVLMHLPQPQIAAAIDALKRIVQPGGVLYASLRLSDGADRVDEHGRLYSAFALDDVVRAVGPWPLLQCEERVSQSSGRRIAVVAARRPTS